ncbi:hypothetical protein DFH08DRAFT_906377 [Mycena albidolilacea]|uniref:Uncharacterized protein n=1 Tax=Mycena albidolilacea TaxID=1033008 RepID=A0AAD6YYX7_9AGAR|nr:hypothetical protein DFH08DRAFT_906377 [Mycena albidolilacea]
MRRVRGGPVLQPFVEDRPPDAPAGNVFASGPFATASSAAAAAGAARRANAFGPPASASSASAAHAGAGTGAVLTPSASAAGSAAPPPAFVGGAATLGIYPSEKTPEIAYTNQQPQPGPSQQVSRQPSQSSQSDASTSRIDTTDKQREMERETGLPPSTSTLISPSTTESASDTSARERYLEQRLATLEAHVASYLPPPYEQPDP